MTHGYGPRNHSRLARRQQHFMHANPNPKPNQAVGSFQRLCHYRLVVVDKATMSRGGGAAAGGVGGAKGKKKRVMFTIDCAKPMEDKIMDVASLEKPELFATPSPSLVKRARSPSPPPSLSESFHHHHNYQRERERERRGREVQISNISPAASTFVRHRRSPRTPFLTQNHGDSEPSEGGFGGAAASDAVDFPGATRVLERGRIADDAGDALMIRAMLSYFEGFQVWVRERAAGESGRREKMSEERKRERKRDLFFCFRLVIV
ncbi:hypothetical protein CsSME_00033152 [Camellia sinensis var. sinensis]